MSVSRDELRNVATFAGLPDEQLDWFLEHATEFQLQPGDIYVRAGDPADKMLVLIEGELLVRLDPPDEGIYLTRAGTVTGVLPYSRMTIFPGTGRATKPSRGLTFPKSSFDDLLSHMPELGRRLVGTMVDRTREVTRAEQQRDRLAALGKLSAGLAHELNNPAAAVRRTAERLRAVVGDFRSSVSQLEGIQLTEPERTAIEAFETGCCTQEPERDVLKASQLQDDIEEMLREHGIEDGWQYASSLVDSGALPQPLHTMLEAVRPVAASPALKRVSAMVELNGLLDELEDSTSKISDLVKAIKEYSYMDQAPVQDVDVARGLEATLTILGHKLRKGITVERYYHPTPLLVNSYGSELNQVWTNIIDNAIDAMQGKGVLRIKTYADDGSAVVVIGDSGPGIPPDVQSHIFEPFFTTKGVGEGTGLGLDTVMRIIRKHQGSIAVTSAPGDTRFRISLPGLRSPGEENRQNGK